MADGEPLGQVRSAFNPVLKKDFKMARDSELTGERRYTCDICGFDYRESDTVINSDGLRVCTVIPCLSEDK